MFGDFIKASVKAVKTKDNLGEITKVLEHLAKQDVLVGIPQAEASRKEGKLNNAELAYIHSNGSPKNNIPARPFLEPSIINNKRQVVKQQTKALRDALDGNTAQADADLHDLGLLGQSLAKGWFTDPRNHWAPLSPYTVEQRLKKKFKSPEARAQGMEEYLQSIQIEGGTPTERPLIDSGQLRNAITYVIRQK